MRRVSLPQLIRHRQKMPQAFFAGCRGIKKRFWCLLGLWPKGTAARHPCVIVRKVIAPHTRAKDGRHFAVRRKTGIFPAKSAFPAYVLAASEIARRQFRRRGFFMRSSPGWPASDFRVLSPRDIYGTFCLGSIWLNAGRPAPGMLSVNWQRPPKAGGRKAQGCGRERACSLAPKAQPVAPGEERVIHSSRPPEVT